jgi:hypothetical protein
MAATSSNGAGPGPGGLQSGSVSPRTVTAPKTVQFVLVFQDSPYRARLPLRVSIYPHDTTDSIITTVKNFYGLYSGPTVSKGVSFEDEQRNTLIARYENFRNNMTVYVRVIEELPPFGSHGYHAAQGGPQSYYSANGYGPPAPQQSEHHGPRPTSRTSRLRSPSPNSGRGRRSTSAGTNPAGGKKGRSRSSKNRSQTNGDGHSDSFNGYSSGDGAPGSSSGRAKEQLGNTDISVENIVEGGRRKRAKFESSVRREFGLARSSMFRSLIFITLAGATSLRSSADACRHLQSVSVAGSTDGPSPQLSALHSIGAESVQQPRPASIPAGLS